LGFVLERLAVKFSLGQRAQMRNFRRHFRLVSSRVLGRVQAPSEVRHLRDALGEQFAVDERVVRILVRDLHGVADGSQRLLRRKSVLPREVAHRADPLLGEQGPQFENAADQITCMGGVVREDRVALQAPRAELDDAAARRPVVLVLCVDVLLLRHELLAPPRRDLDQELLPRVRIQVPVDGADLDGPPHALRVHNEHPVQRLACHLLNTRT